MHWGELALPGGGDGGGGSGFIGILGSSMVMAPWVEFDVIRPEAMA